VGLLAFPSLLGGLPTAVAAGAIGFVAPLVWLRMRCAKRLNLFEQDLPDSLELVAGSLRAGYGIAHGFELVSRENQGPCGEEFAQVLQEIGLGAELDTALGRVVERVDSEDARLLATAVGVQRRTGGNLINVLMQMAQVLRERQRLRREVHVITTAPRISGYVVSLLPLGVAIVMYFTARYYILMLIDEPIGRVAIALSVVLVALGLFLNRRIASIDM
jgi:tight adherence protein B